MPQGKKISLQEARERLEKKETESRRMRESAGLPEDDSNRFKSPEAAEFEKGQEETRNATGNILSLKQKRAEEEEIRLKNIKETKERAQELNKIKIEEEAEKARKKFRISR